MLLAESTRLLSPENYPLQVHVGGSSIGGLSTNTFTCLLHGLDVNLRIENTLRLVNSISLAVTEIDMLAFSLSCSVKT